MSYTESLETLLHRIIAVLILPDWLMSKSLPTLRSDGTDSSQKTRLSSYSVMREPRTWSGESICTRYTLANRTAF